MGLYVPYRTFPWKYVFGGTSIKRQVSVYPLTTKKTQASALPKVVWYILCKVSRSLCCKYIASCQEKRSFPEKLGGSRRRAVPYAPSRSSRFVGKDAAWVLVSWYKYDHRVGRTYA